MLPGVSGMIVIMFANMSLRETEHSTLTLTTGWLCLPGSCEEMSRPLWLRLRRITDLEIG